MKNYLKINFQSGWFRLWILSTLILFVYTFSNTPFPYFPDYLPHLLVSPSINIQFFVHQIIGTFTDYYSNFLSSFTFGISVCFIYTLYSLFLYLSVRWVYKGFKK
jgi:hypothetical protein